MQDFYGMIEQLDLAATQLAVGRPAYARFALLLTDNVVELLFHRKCESLVRLDQPISGFQRSTYNPEAMVEALGQHFEGKAKHCMKRGAITADDSTLAITCHSYRNELYHVGIKYEPIIGALAWVYHELACRLFRTLQNGYSTYTADTTVSEAVQRHLRVVKKESYLCPDGSLAALAGSLDAARPPLGEPLGQQLSAFAVAAVEGETETFEWLADYAEKDALREIQFRHDSLRKMDRSEIRSPAQYLRALHEFERKWKPTYPKNPLARWMRRAVALKGEKAAVGALTKFQGLRKEMAYFEAVTLLVGRELDQSIQLENDIALGK